MLIASAISFVIINVFGSVDKATLNLAAQSLISMVAFLAGASIVMTSFYMGQVLKGVPDTANRLIPSLEGVMNKMAPQLVPELLEIHKEGKGPLELWKAILASFAFAFKETWSDWSKALEGLAAFPEILRKTGSHTIYWLIVSAFFSILTILSGSIFLLGLSFASIIIAVEALLRSWRTAEAAMQGSLFVSSFYTFLERMKDSRLYDKLSESREKIDQIEN